MYKQQNSFIVGVKKSPANAGLYVFRNIF